MQTITPEELQALLQQGEPSNRKAAKRRSRLLTGVAVQPYDLQATLTLTPRQRAILRQWADQFVHSLRYALIPALRMTLELRLNHEGLIPLSELASQWKGTAFVFPVTAFGRFRGDLYLALSINLALVAIDRLLGGPGILPSVAIQRPLSRLEVNLLFRFAERIVRSFLNTMTGENSHSIQLQNLLASEEQLAMLTDKVAVYSLCYDFQVGQETGFLWLALFADALKGLEQQMKRHSPPDLKRLRQHPALALTVPLRVILSSGRILVRELKDLKVGDVIVLDGFKGEPVRLVLGERTLCKVRPGTRNGHWAVQILPFKPAQRGEQEDGATQS